MPLMDAFWGDRYGKLVDPFGHEWSIGTHQYHYTPEEIQQKLNERIRPFDGVLLRAKVPRERRGLRSRGEPAYGFVARSINSATWLCRLTRSESCKYIM